MRPLLPLLIAVPSMGAVSAAADPGPMRRLKEAHGKVEGLLRRPVDKGSAAERKVQQEVKGIVNGFLDYEELARRALDSHWEGIAARQRREFVAVLRELIEAHYVRQIRGNLDYQVRYLGEDVEGEEATVRTAVDVERRGRKAEVRIDYKLRRAAGSRWLAWDIVTDDVSLVRNYRSQFNRIIRKDSFAALLDKMKRKLAEVESGEDPAAPAGPT